MTRVLTPITHTEVASLLLGPLFARQGAFAQQFQRGLCCAAKKGREGGGAVCQHEGLFRSLKTNPVLHLSYVIITIIRGN